MFQVYPNPNEGNSSGVGNAFTDAEYANTGNEENESAEMIKYYNT